MVERFFKLKEHNTTIKTEIIAGFTTFLSMVYILAVNPTILSAAGMEPAAVFTATVVSAVAATAFMAFFANYPIALASGMGLNAYFAFSVCIPLAEAGIQDPWKIALTAVLVEGIIFVILSFFKFRETLVNKIPENLKYGITAGIGLFIAFVGMQGAKIIVKNDATLVDLGAMNQPQVVLALVGLLLIGVLYHFRVVGFMLWGILITWGLGMLAQGLGWYAVDPDAGMRSLFPDFDGGLAPAAPNFLAFNFEYAAKHFFEFAVIVFSFLFVDLFDTAGALVGIAAKADLLDKDGNLPKAGAALMSDALGTIVGACLGTSTVTTYIESSAGVANGGRTGLTALTTAGLFILALFFSPIFLAVPAFATTPALIFVGLLMMSAVKKMDFESDMAAAMGGFLAIIIMPLTYSIANGIMFGILAYVIIKSCQGQVRTIHPVMWVSSGLFIARILTMVM
ncbi:MAG: NCS2 family permease [Anaerovoracaceae bacterium]|jgi:AGZA family xanthine/uracil permease-like MFS transporter